MKHTHECVITGDTNDGDTIESRFDFTPGSNEVEYAYGFKPGEIFPESPGFTKMQVVDALIKAIQCPRTERHNWSRAEFDSKLASNQTIYWVCKFLFNKDLHLMEDVEDDADYIDVDPIYDDMFDAISNILPYGEFGIHTIGNIYTQPKSAKTSLYKEPTYGKRRKYLDVASNQIAIVALSENGTILQFREENGVFSTLMPDLDFVPSSLTSRQQMIEFGFKIIWDVQNES